MSSRENLEPITYRHTQNSPLFFIMLVIAGVMVAWGWMSREETPALLVLLLVGAIFAIVAFSFYSLTTTIEDGSLRLKYGPIPLFGTRLSLADIQYAESGRTAWIDGWGIHYIPFRGWTFNLWGFDCVKIEYRGRTIRIGSNDAMNLSEKLTEAIGRDPTQPVPGADSAS